LNFTRSDSDLDSAIGGEPLRGTLYDTYDFTLRGGRFSTTYSMRGRVVVGTASSDAGVHLSGTLTTTSTDGGTTCAVQESFSADRL
jgi:hypothetical protein